MNLIGNVILAETIELKSLWTNQRLNVHRIHETVNKWNSFFKSDDSMHDPGRAREVERRWVS